MNPTQDLRAPHRWVVILAGGEGVALLRGHTLLEHTAARFSPVAPPERMVVVVPRFFEDRARALLSPWPGIRVILQPSNPGTGLGVLLGLAHIMAQDPEAQVLISPSDQYVSRPAPLLAGIAAAFATDAPLTLIGAVPDGPDTDYGWIVPGDQLSSGACGVALFVEKPAPAIAAKLLDGGGLWNTFIMTGKASAIWAASAQHLPQQVARIVEHAHSYGDLLSRRVLNRLSQRVVPADFSRDVLQHVPGLAVVRVEGSGLADWGTPRRVRIARAADPTLDVVLIREVGHGAAESAHVSV